MGNGHYRRHGSHLLPRWFHGLLRDALVELARSQHLRLQSAFDVLGSVGLELALFASLQGLDHKQLQKGNTVKSTMKIWHKWPKGDWTPYLVNAIDGQFMLKTYPQYYSETSNVPERTDDEREERRGRRGRR